LYSQCLYLFCFSEFIIFKIFSSKCISKIKTSCFFFRDFLASLYAFSIFFGVKIVIVFLLISHHFCWGDSQKKEKKKFIVFLSFPSSPTLAKIFKWTSFVSRLQRTAEAHIPTLRSSRPRQVQREHTRVSTTASISTTQENILGVTCLGSSSSRPYSSYSVISI